MPEADMDGEEARISAIQHRAIDTANYLT